MSLTVQNIVDGVASDIRNVLNVEQNGALLTDWTNRISLDLLQFSNWRFLISGPKRFITEMQRTDYWIGATAGNPSTAVDTGLNLTDFQRVIDRTVRDRSNGRDLGRVLEIPDNLFFQTPDTAPRPNKPRQWRQSQDTPSIINIYPAPDNTNTFLPIPNTPVVERATGGALANRSYYLTATLVDNAGGQSTPALPTLEYVLAGQLAKIRAVVAPITAASSGILYNQYNVYAGTSSSNMTLQNVSPIANTVDWTEPVGGLTTSGAAVPTVSTLAPMYGYLIEFRYLQTRTQLTALTGVLQIPSDYKDVVIAGVNLYASKYLGNDANIQFWAMAYDQGKQRMIKDKNYTEGAYDYIVTDPAAVPVNPNSMSLLDYSQLTP